MAKKSTPDLLSVTEWECAKHGTMPTPKTKNAKCLRCGNPLTENTWVMRA